MNGRIGSQSSVKRQAFILRMAQVGEVSGWLSRPSPAHSPSVPVQQDDEE